MSARPAAATEVAEDPPLVFIVGCPRSGTTWISRIFLQHPRVVHTFEAALFSFLTTPWWELGAEGEAMPPPPRPGLDDLWLDFLEWLLVRLRPRWYEDWREQLISYFDDRRSFILHHSRLGPPDDEWVKLRAPLVTYRELLELIDAAEGAGLASREEKVVHVARAVYRRFFARHGGGPDDVLVDKSPGQIFHAELILDHFPTARFIEALRDGRDVCVSMDAYAKHMPQEREVQASMWNAFARKGLALRREPAYADRILEVRFEELKRDPPARIREMLAFAGLETSPEEAERIARATDIRNVGDAGEGRHVRRGRVGDWQKRLDPADLELFRRRAGEVFVERGYEW